MRVISSLLGQEMHMREIIIMLSTVGIRSKAPRITNPGATPSHGSPSSSSGSNLSGTGSHIRKSK
jgi:hypothetical protein